MDEEFSSKYSVKIATTEEERKKLPHLTSYTFISSPAYLTI